MLTRELIEGRVEMCVVTDFAPPKNKKVLLMGARFYKQATPTGFRAQNASRTVQMLAFAAIPGVFHAVGRVFFTKNGAISTKIAPISGEFGTKAVEMRAISGEF